MVSPQCADDDCQSAVVYFLIYYAYMTTSSRPDGYDVYQYEFSTVSDGNSRASRRRLLT